MKTSVKEVGKLVEEKFPKLVKEKNSGTIFLVTEKRGGAYSATHLTGIYLGHYTKLISNMVEDFYGTVTLSND